MAIYVEIGALIVAAFLLYAVFRFLKDPLLMILNSVLGFIALVILNSVFALGIAINIWSIAIIALGGIGGLILVVLLNFLGLGF